MYKNEREKEILDCDLLIIDDLGSEFSTQFTVAALYNIINTRINRSKPVIISTNLTETELDLLPVGAMMMTFECGMRFLTDYLEGDTYFHTRRAGQNLDRCRTQFKLVKDMEEQFDAMAAVIKKYSN